MESRILTSNEQRLRGRAAAVLAALSVVGASLAVADTFGTGENVFEIEFVLIEEPGNPADTEGHPNPAGSVNYIYRIGKYEISEAQMRKAIAEGNLAINLSTRGPGKPATSISWLEAAIFVNWLNTSTGYPPAYQIRPPVPPFIDPTYHNWEPSDPGYDPANPYRSRLAKYVIPSADEWYKAAYFNPVSDVYYEFPTGGNRAPEPVPAGTAPNTAVFNQNHNSQPADVTQAGGLSPFGTMGQGGNAYEWNESPYFGDYSDPYATRIIRGGDWSSYDGGVDALKRSRSDAWTIWGGGSTWGLRVASVEPLPTAVRGDLNCDGTLDFFDVDPFLLALFDSVGYAAAFPDCELMNGDMDESGAVDFLDIDLFVSCLLGGC